MCVLYIKKRMWGHFGIRP